MKKYLILAAGFILIAFNAFAQDIAIDGNGNLTTGTSNSYGNLKVTGASGEHGIAGEAQGTGAAGVYGKSTDSNNYGALGSDEYGVYGYSSGGHAGYFEGDARVTGNLTVNGTISGETDPTVAASVKDGVDWTELSGIPSDFADGIDNTIWTQSGSDIYYNSGNIGIATSTPAGKLDVNGDICLGGVCRTTWPSGSATGAFTDTGTTAYYTGGNVGIGTTDPVPLENTDTRVLHLKQATGLLDSTAAGIRLEVDGIVNGGIVSAYTPGVDAGVFVGALSNHRLGFITNSMEKMSLTPNGNLGIGTVSPVQPLHVEGNTYISEYLGIGTASPTNNLQVSGSNALLSSDTGDFRLYVSKKLTADAASIIFQDNFTGYAEMGLTGDNAFHFRVSTDNGVSFTDAMLIDNANARIGMGLWPDSKLHVLSDNSDPALIAESTGSSYSLMAWKKSDGDAVNIYKTTGTGYALRIYQGGTDSVMIIKNSTSDIFIIENDGDTGIGTSAPTARLDINGTTGYDQLRVRTPYTPTGSSDTNGNVGDLAWDDNFVYVKTSAGWKRSTLNSF